MTQRMNRRAALRVFGASAALATVAGAVKGEEKDIRNAALVDGAEAWKYEPVEPDEVADAAYANYKAGRCMYTTFRAVVASVAKALESRDPMAAREIAAFPFHMMRYGDSGGNGWGATCGSLNGAMAAVGLFVSDSNARKTICDQLALYYEQTMLPCYKPPQAREEQGYTQTISNSILCHISSAKWAAAAKVRTNSPERTERCSRLSADLAQKTVELLNLNLAALNDSKVEPIGPLKKRQPAKECAECHDKSGTNADMIGKMNCTECHPEKTVEHHLE